MTTACPQAVQAVSFCDRPLPLPAKVLLAAMLPGCPAAVPGPRDDEQPIGSYSPLIPKSLRSSGLLVKR